jgi:hypothetical protein
MGTRAAIVGISTFLGNRFITIPFTVDHIERAWVSFGRFGNLRTAGTLEGLAKYSVPRERL